MANNRMYLVEKRTGNRILLCKFYPRTRWYLFSTEEEINKWLVSATETTVYGYGADDLFGPSSFELQFETVEDGRDDKLLITHQPTRGTSRADL